MVFKLRLEEDPSTIPLGHLVQGYLEIQNHQASVIISPEQQISKMQFKEANIIYLSERAHQSCDRKLVLNNKSQVQIRQAKIMIGFQSAHNSNNSYLRRLFNRELQKTRRRDRRTEMAVSFQHKTAGAKPYTIRTLCKVTDLVRVKCCFR